jgi:hypothetical protein
MKSQYCRSVVDIDKNAKDLIRMIKEKINFKSEIFGKKKQKW